MSISGINEGRARYGGIRKGFACGVGVSSRRPSPARYSTLIHKISIKYQIVHET